MVTMFQARELYLVWERIKSKLIITDIKKNFFRFLLIIKCHTFRFQSGNLLVYCICLLHNRSKSSTNLLTFT